MAFDFNEAREIVEAAKKRGLIRAEGEAAPLPAPKQTGVEKTVFPEWLQASIRDPSQPAGFMPDDNRPERR